MKLTISILALGLLAGSALAQNPDQIENTRNTLKAVQQKQAIDSNAALGGRSQTSAPARASQPVSHKTVKPSPRAAKKEAAPKQSITVENTSTKPVEAKKEEKSKQISFTGERDPFVSPVVIRALSGSGCSNGKRCLAVDQINLKGVVKSEDGMIAVVVNALDKAYFLRENDPVFNGYVVKITGDSVVFRETVQDKLGKPFTREVTKKITTPAV